MPSLYAVNVHPQRLGAFPPLVQVDELEATRCHVSREEQELRDVEREMEAQLNQQHSQVGCVGVLGVEGVSGRLKGGEGGGEGRTGEGGMRKRDL